MEGGVKILLDIDKVVRKLKYLKQQVKKLIYHRRIK
jgi:hypothetical protein